MRNISMTAYMHVTANSKISLCLSNTAVFANSAVQSLTNMDYVFAPESAKGFISLRKL